MNEGSTKNLTPLIIGGISLLVVAGALGFFFLSANSSDSTNTSGSDNNASQNGIENTKDTTSAADPNGSGFPIEEYSGNLLSGDPAKSPLLAFEKSDYDKAIASDKLVVLYFFANWCPICKEEFPKMGEVFDGLENGDVVGFRVNYNDNETDNHERDLASELGVAYQHTKVFLKNGERVLKSPESWEKDRYVEEINKAL